ncbi:MAG: hypothetical protein HQM06_18070, partial [Magnetococcales bacterium]|nr:hypothetical protein [Magnetococcales bacterium]
MATVLPVKSIPVGNTRTLGEFTSTDQIHPDHVAITGAASMILTENLATGLVLVSDANGKVSSSGISTEKLLYLDNVTGDIQSQLSGMVTL